MCKSLFGFPASKVFGVGGRRRVCDSVGEFVDF